VSQIHECPISRGVMSTMTYEYRRPASGVEAMTSPNQIQRPLALVRGASSGIGRELARVAARDGYHLIVVARRADRLAAQATELPALGAATEQVVGDLAQPTGTQIVEAAIAGRPVEVLVNDAGVGGRGRFATARQLAADLAMIKLNITTLVELMGLPRRHDPNRSSESSGPSLAADRTGKSVPESLK
jgi:NAD(P)-dependent dehydrogenase (short-subunit alcohol dehydrogenase family)